MSREIIYFIFWGVVSRGAPFLLLPVIARIIPTHVFSEFALFLPMSAFCMMLLLMGTQFELTRIYFDEKKSIIKQLASASIRLHVCLALILWTFAFVFDMGSIWFYSILQGLAVALFMMPILCLRMEGKIHVFGIFDTLRISLPYFFLLLTVFIKDFNYMLFSSLSFLLLYFVCNRFLSFSLIGKNKDIDKDEQAGPYSVLSLLSAGFFLLPHYLSSYVLPVLDRYLISRTWGDGDVANYAMGVILGQSVLLVTDAFNKWWSPYAIKNMEFNYDAVIAKAKRLALYALMAAPIIGAFVYFFAKIYFPVGYDLAAQVAACCAVSYSVQVLYYLIFPFLLFKNKMNVLSVFSVAGLLLGASVVFLLVFLKMLPFVPLGYMTIYFVQVMGIFWVVFYSKEKL